MEILLGLIYSSEGLSGVQKFNYLRAVMLFMLLLDFHLQMTTMVILLCNRFEQPYKLVNAHMELPLNLGIIYQV